MKRGRNRASTGSIITPISRDRYPSRLLIFDTEAIRGEIVDGVEVQILKLGVGRYIELNNDLSIIDDNYHNFNSLAGLVEVIHHYERKDKPLYVYAHNLKYDLQLTGLLPYLLEEGYSVTKFVINDPPTFIRLNKNRNNIVMVDTFNYWQTSVKAMGEQLGLPKLDMPDNNDNDEIWYTYCKRDVMVLSEYILAFMRWLKGNDLGGLAMTLAGQAFRTYRKRFLQADITIHNYPAPLSLERDSYSGARTEAYFQGKLSGENWYKLDVNSMYPYVMKMDTYPIQMRAHTRDIPLLQLQSLLERYYVIARVIVNTDTPAYAVKRDGKLVFPVGKFITVLHDAELRYAMEYGHIHEVIEVAIYTRGSIFSDYVDYFYDSKQKADMVGDKIGRQLSKTMMNALYGKFGQRGIHSQIIPNKGQIRFGRFIGYSEKLKCAVTVIYLGDKMEITYPLSESYYSMPAIAGAVTANARMYLYHLITLAGRRHVVYCDTDSLIVDELGYSRLISRMDNIKLGYLKLEGISNQLLIFGVKDYAFGDEKHIKGVPKTAIPVGDNSWLYEQFTGALGWLNKGLPSGVTVKSTLKTRTGNYTKGLVQDNGDILPLVLSIDGEG